MDTDTRIVDEADGLFPGGDEGDRRVAYRVACGMARAQAERVEACRMVETRRREDMAARHAPPMAPVRRAAADGPRPGRGDR